MARALSTAPDRSKAARGTGAAPDPGIQLLLRIAMGRVGESWCQKSQGLSGLVGALRAGRDSTLTPKHVQSRRAPCLLPETPFP